MTDRKDWKAVADNCMKDIQVSEELKIKTLERCMRKSRFPVGRLLAAAACLVIFLGISQLYWKVPSQPNVSEQGRSMERNIMSATDGKAEASGIGTFAATAEGNAAGVQSAGSEAAGTGATGTEATGERMPKTAAEARIAFGAGFLEPAEIPEGYSPGEIFASGQVGGSVEKVTLSYFKKEYSFFLSEEKSEKPTVETGEYKKVNINGTTGYMRNGKENSTGTRQGGDIELNWYKDGVRYAITGALTEKEALDMALSMK